MKRGIRFLSLLLALLLLGGTLVGCAAVTKPLNYVKKSLEKTIDRRFGGEIFEVLLEALESGSIEVGFGGTDLAVTPLEAASAKVWFDREGQQLTASGSVTVGGKLYDGDIYLTTEQMALSSVAFFGSTDFGVHFGTLASDLENSIFRNNSRTDFARPEVDEGTAADVNKLKNSLFTLYGSVGDLLELSDELAEDFLKILTEYAPHSRYADNGRIHISATVDNAVLSRALRDTRAKAVKDKAFCRELREIAATRDTVTSVKNGTVVTEWSDKVENFIASDISIEELCAKIDALPAFTVQLNAVIGRMSGIIETAQISYTVDGTQLFDFALDLSDDQTNVIRVTYKEVTRTLTYRVLKDGIRRYQSELSYAQTTASGETAVYVTGTLFADRHDDAFTLSLTKGEETRVFEGGFDKTIDGFNVSVNAVKINETQHRFAVSLTVKTDDKAEKMPEYVNLATVPEARFEPIYTRLTGAQDELKAAWGDYRVTPRTVLSFLLTVVGVTEEIPPEPTE